MHPKISAQTVDEKCYDYMADGQVANVNYNYQGLDEHQMSYTYNDVRIPIGKRYTHPTESGYNFEWRTNIDNFARPQSNVSIWNGVETQTGEYYYDVLGNLLMKGLGSTGNSADPHLDYHFFKFDIRDQLSHNTSKHFRFGLKHDPQGNITDQFWSNEFFDPTNGATVDINQYHYYYDDMNRLIGADYRLGTMSEDPFADFDDLFGDIPNDFLCGVNNIAVDEYIEPVFAEFELNIENGENVSQSTESLNGLNVLKVEYKQMDIAYSQMTEVNKENLFTNYIEKMNRGRIDPKAYELYRSEQAGDMDHYDLVKDGPMTSAKMKYTQILLSGLPYNASVQCDANMNATVYGFLPTFPFPTIISNSKKYDAAYWYTENGNITDLNRNDENEDKAEQDYAYSNPLNNQLSQVDWSGTAIPNETHNYNYDANGNILTDSRNGVTDISYDDYDELPTSITNGNGTRNYRYDANGQRIVKEIDANDKNYYLDGVIVDQNNEVISYQTPEGYVTTSNTGGAIIADCFYSVPDWLGTNRAIMDANGNVLNASDHYPFGKRMPARYMVTDAEGNRYQYTGHEFDEETGYGYHGARYYNRELGRYMNVDRYAEKFYGQSPYVYAGNQVVNAIDVNGDKGYLIRVDRDADGNLSDNLVFSQNEDGSLKSIGELTDKISADGWFDNLLESNGKQVVHIGNGGGNNPWKFKTAIEKDGKWDYKNLNNSNQDIGNNQKFPHILGLAFSMDENTDFTYRNEEYRSEDLNNFHFGFLSNAFGFPEKTSQRLAGFIEMGKRKNEGKDVPASWRPTEVSKNPLSPFFMQEVLLPPYGDNPIDHEMIKKGMKLYNEL